MLHNLLCRFLWSSQQRVRASFVAVTKDWQFSVYLVRDQEVKQVVEQRFSDIQALKGELTVLQPISQRNF